MNKNVLILGSDGMVGRNVFQYLNELYPDHIWGTTRHKQNLSKQKKYFSIDTYQKDFSTLQKRLGKVDYVINCIGVKDNSQPIKEFISANALFPHLLEELAKENNFKLIHISTDAVFSQTSGKVSETSETAPYNHYGMTKLLGETSSKNSLTIRTSIIGLDPVRKEGLLENMRKSKSILSASTNHHWSGCTTIQFAKLCEVIILKNRFTNLRKQSPVFHFAPLFDITRYQLAKTFLDVLNTKKEIKRVTTEQITRLLVSNYVESLSLGKNQTLKEALQELML